MTPAYPLFSRFGVELEYMIVDSETLDVRPEADKLIHSVVGAYESDVPRGALEWSNELALHLIELKTGSPVTELDGLADVFQGEVQFINDRLKLNGQRLLPTAMHPWMNPHLESRLWPHGNREIYETFDRIFDCSGHGWINLQAAHLNLPFANDDEFARLHAAIRLLLALLPAVAASSPFVDGRPAPALDMRLEVYRQNCRRIPSITGQVIPEPVTSRTAYEREILQPIYRDLHPYDPAGILQEEWANARGAIARFERNTIEIRVLDIQECPAADLAILQLIAAVLKNLTLRSDCVETMNSISGEQLERILTATTERADAALISDAAFVQALGLPRDAISAGDAWKHLAERAIPSGAPWQQSVDSLLRSGCLARRILTAVGPTPDREQLKKVYRELADCLETGRLFRV